ncbi:MAG: response regulator transcription factor [Actinomycetota bacterium]
MTRLLWLSMQRADPEESFPALLGRRPAPEPLMFSEITSDILSRRAVDIVLVDCRDDPADGSALIRKLRSEAGIVFIALINRLDAADFDWTVGVSDFVVDGCSREELDVRLTRAAGPAASDLADPMYEVGMMRRGAITINRERFEVRLAGNVLDLTFKEFELIAYLAERPGKVCSRSALLSEVWGYDFFGGTRTVDVHIRRLRAKLGPEAHAIETVRNVGYRFAGH